MATALLFVAYQSLPLVPLGKPRSTGLVFPTVIVFPELPVVIPLAPVEW
jgi:hypothetical protein